MNHSIVTADRTTHVKIIVIALIGATLVTLVGIKSTLGDRTSTQFAAGAPVVKAEKQISISGLDMSAVR
jgi:hypothetical protein